MIADKPLTPTQVCKTLGVDIKTLKSWRESGGGPPYFVLTAPGKHRTLVRYPREEFGKWFEGRFFNNAQTLIEDHAEEERKDG